MKVSIEGQGHFLTLFFSRFCGFTRPRYQVSIYSTIGPLVHVLNYGLPHYNTSHCNRDFNITQSSLGSQIFYFPILMYKDHPISSDNYPIKQNLFLQDVFQ